MGFFEDDENEDFYGDNPNEEVVNTSSKEEVKEKKNDEPKKKKMELEKRTHTSSGLLNIGKSQEYLSELIFMVKKLEFVLKEIKNIKHLDQIQEHVKNLQNITIDTSNFETVFQNEIKKLTTKIESIVDNADLHELDEISKRIKDMNRTFKKQRYLSFFLISVFAYASGYLTYSFFPLENIKQDEITRIAKKAKENGVAFQKHKGDDVIAIPTKIGGTMSKNRKYIVYKIKKD